MGRSGRRQGRLVELSHEVGVSQEYPGLHLSPNATAVPAEHDQFLQDALNRTRSVRFESKRHLIRRKPSKAAPKAQEATETLEQLVITRQCSAGHAEALIRMGANVNFSRQKSKSLVKRIRNKDQEDVRSTLLQAAVEQSDPDLTKVLVKEADQETLDEVLRAAIVKEDLETMQTAMSRGANPNLYESAFCDAVRDGKTNIVCVLSSGRNPPSDSIVTKALPHIVNSHQLRILSMLLWLGADADHNGASAFLRAAQAGNRALVAAFCLAKKPPSPASLAEAVDRVCVGDEIGIAEHIKLVETILAAGAKGENISTVLERMTRQKHYNLVELLVGYIDFDEHHSSEAIRIAISRGDIRLFLSLVPMNSDCGTLDSLLLYTLSMRRKIPQDTRISMIKALVGQRPSNLGISNALIDVTTNDELDLAEYLVKEGASVDHENGRALKIAVERQSINLVAVLLAGEPTLECLVSSFAAARSIPDPNNRFEIMEKLLTKGARGKPVDQALVDVVDGSHDSERSVVLLLRKGEANVDFNQGESVCRAVRHQNDAVLQHLVEKLPSTDTLNRAFVECVALHEPTRRLYIGRILLQAGVGEEAKGKALVSSVRMNECDLSFVKLLLSFNASVDFDLGSPLRTAILRQNITLLSILLGHSANSETLKRGLVDILDIEDKEMKLEFATMLLGVGSRFLKEELEKLLPQTFDTSDDIRILDLFLQDGASINEGGAKALVKAITLKHKTALHLMLQFQPSTTVVQAIFARAWALKDPGRLELLKIIVASENERNAIDISAYLVKALEEAPRSEELITFLLNNNASIEYSDSQCLHLAVSDLDYRTLSKLVPKAKSRSGVSSAFGTAMRSDETWKNCSGFNCLSLLLEYGAAGPVIDEAMLKAVKYHDKYEFAPLILNEVIEYNASPNFDNGITLEAAAETGSSSVLRTLFDCSPSAATVTTAFPYIFLADVDEKTILHLVELFWERFSGELDLNATHRELPPILFLCMQRYPGKLTILQSLLQKVTSLEQEIVERVDEEFGEESVTVLLWAILQHSNTVTDAMIELLIKAGANIYFVSSSRTTPLLAAAKQSRTYIVETLLHRQVDVSMRDFADRSALFHATLCGNFEIMRLLIEAGALPDDGSIHEAARRGNSKAVQILLSADHGPNFPSPMHGWRSPMEELVTKGAVKWDQAAEFKTTIEALIEGGANQEYQHNNGKSLLFLAIDSADASMMTTILLSGFMDKFINNEFNNYKQNGYVYSALSYVIKDQQLSNREYKPALTQILRNYGCKEIYYREEGDQPIGFTGAPENIRREEERRRERSRRLAEQQDDFEIEQGRRRDAAHRAQELEQQAHRLHLQQDSERAEQRLQAERTHNLEQERFAEHRRGADMEHQRMLNTARLETTRQETQLQLEYKKASAVQDQHVIDARRNAERQTQEMELITLKEKDRLAQSYHQRNMKEIEAKREGTREQSRLLDKQRELAQLASSAQRYLTYDERPD